MDHVKMLHLMTSMKPSAKEYGLNRGIALSFSDNFLEKKSFFTSNLVGCINLDLESFNVIKLNPKLRVCLV